MWTSIILVFWYLWRHRNNVVFNGTNPAMHAVKTRMKEYEPWRLARLYISEGFGSPEPVSLWWHEGE
jgi:hypothetical protein